MSKHSQNSYKVRYYKCLDLYLEEADYVIIEIGLVDCWNRKGRKWAPFKHMEGKDPWVNENEYK